MDLKARSINVEDFNFQPQAFHTKRAGRKSICQKLAAILISLVTNLHSSDSFVVCLENLAFLSAEVAHVFTRKRNVLNNYENM